MADAHDPTVPEGTGATPGDDAAFRAAVRAFVAERAPRLRFAEGTRAPRDADEERAIRAWLGALHDAGYLGGGWPPAWGGRPDHRPVQDLIVMEELFRARAYRPPEQGSLASHAVLANGSDEQRRDLLPRIRSGEHVWCQLFSEPDAGSDLASLRTRAVPDDSGPDDGGHVVTGQKVWTTDAHWADMGLLLARTDPTAERHAGLTAFVVPMRTPGITIRPIREMTGSEEFCEVFLDEVRLGAEHVLGDLHGGWAVVTSSLASERAVVGANAVQLELMFDDLVALARAVVLPDGARAIDHDDVGLRLALALARVEAARLVVEDVVDRILRNEEHPSDGAISKLAYSELHVELCELALDVLASGDLVAGDHHDGDDDPGEVVDRWHAAFLWSRALTISGGSSEILRGLVGRQLLDLPRA